MAGARLRIDVDVEAAESALRRMVGTLDGPGAQAVFDEIGQALVTSTVHRFERETGPDGQPWKPSRRAREEGGQTLTDKGRLRGSITHVAGPTFVDVGTNVLHAAIHQFGGEIRPKGSGKLYIQRGGAVTAVVDSVTMPARPFLGVDDADRDAISEILLDALERAAA